MFFFCFFARFRTSRIFCLLITILNNDRQNRSVEIGLFSKFLNYGHLGHVFFLYTHTEYCVKFLGSWVMYNYIVKGVIDFRFSNPNLLAAWCQTMKIIRFWCAIPLKNRLDSLVTNLNKNKKYWKLTWYLAKTCFLRTLIIFL